MKVAVFSVWISLVPIALCAAPILVPKPFEDVAYVSVAHIERGGESTQLVSEGRRSLSQVQPFASWGRSFMNNYKDRFIKGVEFRYQPSEDALHPRAVSLEQFLAFGVPDTHPYRDISLGDRWRSDFTLSLDDTEVQVVVSYTFSSVERLMDRDVARIDLIMSSFSTDQGGVRLFGAGEEIWDIERGMPFIRMVEVRKKGSGTDDEMKVSYAESRFLF